MKISKAYIERFKKAFIYWQKKFGLTQYNIAFISSDMSSTYSMLKVSETDKVGTVFIPLKLVRLDADLDEGPEINALHEICHLLINRLTWLGENRYLSSGDLYEENESVVVRLMKVFKETDCAETLR